MKTILMLEDNDERIASFQKVVAGLGNGFDLKIWRDAHSMIVECAEFFPSTALICLDHDLNPQPGVTTDPGTGLDVAKFLADFLPVCPVLIHSSNTDRVYSMHNELRFAGWMADRVGPLGTDWIETTWLRQMFMASFWEIRWGQLAPLRQSPPPRSLRPPPPQLLTPPYWLFRLRHVCRPCNSGRRPADRRSESRPHGRSS